MSGCYCKPWSTFLAPSLADEISRGNDIKTGYSSDNQVFHRPSFLVLLGDEREACCLISLSLPILWTDYSDEHQTVEQNVPHVPERPQRLSEVGQHEVVFLWEIHLFPGASIYLWGMYCRDTQQTGACRIPLWKYHYSLQKHWLITEDGWNIRKQWKLRSLQIFTKARMRMYIMSTDCELSECWRGVHKINLSCKSVVLIHAPQGLTVGSDVDYKQSDVGLSQISHYQTEVVVRMWCFWAA